LAHDGFIRVWLAASRYSMEPGEEGRVVDEAGIPLRGGLSGEWKMRTRKERERKKREESRQRGVDPVGLIVGSPGAPRDPEAAVVDPAGAMFLWSRLSAETRLILALRAEGKTLSEIGSVIGVRRWAVWMRLTKAQEVARRYIREVGAAVLAPWPWLRAHSQRLQGSLVARMPSAWALGELPGLPQCLVSGAAAAVVIAVCCTAAVGGADATGRTIARHSGDRAVGEAPTPSQAPARVSAPSPFAAWRGGDATQPGAGAPAIGLVDHATSLGAARDETPADVHLVSAAAPANYTVSRTIVALGFGAHCQCTVLMTTTDAGVTWQTQQAAYAAEQVVLPPGFPTSDHRIFLGTAASSGIPPYVVNGLDGVPTPLPVPASGHVVLSEAFDRSDARVFVAGTGAVWTVDMTSRETKAAVAYAGAAATALLATAPPGSDTAVLALIPPAPLTALSGGDAPGLYACPIEGGACTLRNRDVPPTTTELVTGSAGGAAASGVTLAVWDGRLHISRDGGASFADALLPPDGARVGYVTAAGGEVWALTTASGVRAHRVMTFDLVTDAWQDVTNAHPTLAGDTMTLVAINAQVILDALATGLLCSNDSGASWRQHC